MHQACGAGGWICEPALWLHWLHRGRLLSSSSAELMSVDVEVFQAIIEDAKCHELDAARIRQYAVAVCTRYVSKFPDTDMWEEREDGEMRRLAAEVLGGARATHRTTADGLGTAASEPATASRSA